MDLQLRGDLGIIFTIHIQMFAVFYKPFDQLNYLREESNHFLNIECRQLGTRDWTNQFARHLFDNSMVENEDDYEVLGVCQTRCNTSIARHHTSLQVNERLNLD